MTRSMTSFLVNRNGEFADRAKRSGVQATAQSQAILKEKSQLEVKSIMMANVEQAIMILVLLYVQPVSGETTTSSTTNCTSNQVGLLENGKVQCWSPRACHIELGLTVKIGKVYPVGTRIACDMCKQGTYSDKYDLSQCKNCKKCGGNEVASGHCLRQKDFTVCKCKGGYFRSADPAHLCKPCNICCDQSNDECSSPKVKKLCSLETSCLQPTSISNSTEINITGNIQQVPVDIDHPISKIPDVKTDDSVNEEVHVTVWVLLSMLTIITSTIAGVVIYSKRNHLRRLHRVGENPQNLYIVQFAPLLRDQEAQQPVVNHNRESDSFEEPENPTFEVTLPLLHRESATNNTRESNSFEGPGNLSITEEPQQSATTNNAWDNDLSKGSGDLTIQALIHESREIPCTLDINGEECTNTPEDVISVTLNSSTELGPRSTPTMLPRETGVCRSCSGEGSTTMVNITEQGYRDFNFNTFGICPQLLLVTQLPDSILQNICNVLDIIDAFFVDYRMLAEELGMEKCEIPNLTNTKSPTYTILEKFKPSIVRFLGIMETCLIVQSREGSDNVHVAERTSNIRSMTDAVKSWLGHSTLSS